MTYHFDPLSRSGASAVAAAEGDMDTANWRRTDLLSDESCFLLSHADGHTHIYRR